MGNKQNNGNSSKPNAAKDGSGSPGESRRPIWQWLLLYPTLAVSVIGAVPTFADAIKSLIRDVPIGKSADAEEQRRLWEVNFECSRTHQPTSLKTPQSIEIASIICDTGDVLLTGKRPDWPAPKFRWVSAKDLAPTAAQSENHSSLLSFISSAEAAEPPHITLAQWGGGQTICQRWVGNGMLMQRIYAPPQGCFDQVINTYNGMVVSRSPAPCTPC